MVISIENRAKLLPFSEVGVRQTMRLEATASAIDGESLKFAFAVDCNLDGLVIPPPRPKRRTSRLWEHTCFEAFIRFDGEPSYFEFNFSPSGEWAAYSFRGYRDGGPFDDEGLSPEIVIGCAPNRIALDAVVRMDRLPVFRPGARLRLGLSAVIEDNDGKLSYWALKHPADKPDFHHPDSFALELALPQRSA